MKHEPILQIKNITKIYPAPTKTGTPMIAVNNVSFSLQKGEILGLLGPNGAGKTTIIHMILGTLTPTKGSIIAFGLDSSQHTTHVREKMGFASTYVDFSQHLTVYENIMVHARLYGMKPKDIKPAVEQSLNDFGVLNQRNKVLSALSAGQKTRVMLATAFVTKPQLILLDEPTASLDPDIAFDVRQFILEKQKTDNISILITSHNMNEVEQVCNRVIVLKEGSIIAHDTPANLAASISTTTIQLNVGDGLKRTQALAQEQGLAYTIKDRWIDITLEEHAIAAFLSSLAQTGVQYAEISIEKPTLEDYFLHIAKND